MTPMVSGMVSDSLLTLPAEKLLKLEDYLPPGRTTFLPEPRANNAPDVYNSKPHPTLPHVTLAYSQSLDGQIALRRGAHTIISGPESEALKHFLRSRHDAVLIGRSTAEVDNPGLNSRFSSDGVRSLGLQYQPRPFILDPSKTWREEKSWKIFDLAEIEHGRAPWWIVSEKQKNMDPRTPNKEQVPEDRARIEKIQSAGGDIIAAGDYQGSEAGVEWEKILRQMAVNGIRSVIIEGGATVINDLLKARNQRFITSLFVTIAPTFMGAGGVGVTPPRTLGDMNEARFCNVTWLPLGQDIVMAGRADLNYAMRGDISSAGLGAPTHMGSIRWRASVRAARARFPTRPPVPTYDAPARIPGSGHNSLLASPARITPSALMELDGPEEQPVRPAHGSRFPRRFSLLLSDVHDNPWSPISITPRDDDTITSSSLNKNSRNSSREISSSDPSTSEPKISSPIQAENTIESLPHLSCLISQDSLKVEAMLALKDEINDGVCVSLAEEKEEHYPRTESPSTVDLAPLLVETSHYSRVKYQGEGERNVIEDGDFSLTTSAQTRETFHEKDFMRSKNSEKQNRALVSVIEVFSHLSDEEQGQEATDTADPSSSAPAEEENWGLIHALQDTSSVSGAEDPGQEEPVSALAPTRFVSLNEKSQESTYLDEPTGFDTGVGDIGPTFTHVEDISFISSSEEHSQGFAQTYDAASSVCTVEEQSQGLAHVFVGMTNLSVCGRHYCG